ncbi:unnamed protein product [Euphydryas editha]|uniref:Uncharacterized protein n=1 Tax=Euphydryas editha TaxID=104508 RepID=A0AAU9UT11_EUPED|nr:unnamed protein product [Euphydryas editha]
MVTTRKLKHDTPHLHMAFESHQASLGLHPEIIRAIYRAVVERVILYTTVVWAPVVARFRAEAMQGIPYSLNPALSLAGLLPLNLRVREAVALYDARGVPQREIGYWGVDRISSALRFPHPAQHINLEFNCPVDQEQLMANDGHDFNIYMDGSKIEGKVGAALSIWSGAAETKTYNNNTLYLHHYEKNNSHNK